MSQYISYEELRAVKPAILSAILRASGWRVFDTAGRPLEVFISPDSRIDVQIPLNQGFNDYRTRLNEALCAVESYFGDQARPIMLQLIAGPMDEILFAEDTMTIHGSIPWNSGETLYDTAREALRAAAKSSGQHLPVFGKKGYPLARRFMDQVRMGQTEKGSYVITALVPLANDELTLPGFEYSLPIEDNFFRRVSSGLMQAAQAAVTAAEEFDRTGSYEPFFDAVNYGVSAELIQALGTMAETHETQVTATWSPLAGEPADTPRTIEVTPGHAPALALAASRFKETSEVTRVTVTGIVTGLDRPRSARTGVSKLDVTAGINARRLRVRLSSGQYDVAVEAHRSRSPVSVTGELSQDRNLYWLYNVRDVEIVPGPPDLFTDLEAEEDQSDT